MDSDSIVRIGLIGAGSIVKQRHIPGFRALPNVRISAVANSTLGSAESFCRDWAPEARPVPHWEAVVDADDVDVIWIGTPPHLHCEATCRALETGKHVFTQARMAGSLSEAERMLEISRRFPHLVTAICPAPGGMRQNDPQGAIPQAAAGLLRPHTPSGPGHHGGGKKRIEIADFALGQFEQTGLGVLVYVNTERCCAKELAMWPRQTCPEHLHPSVGDGRARRRLFGAVGAKCFFTSKGKNPTACIASRPRGVSRPIRYGTRTCSGRVTNTRYIPARSTGSKPVIRGRWFQTRSIELSWGLYGGRKSRTK